MNPAPLRRIVFVIYEGFELLDLAGPMSVFTKADELAGGGRYQIVTVSPEGGAVSCSAGVPVGSHTCSELQLTQHDTVLVTGAGADVLRRAMRHRAILDLMFDAAQRAERYGSICSGTFILGAAGLLNGKRVSTHWLATGQLSTLYPQADTSPDLLYVVDDRMWTSAGVSTGIDMAMAMAEADLGGALAARVARHLVMYARRPGHQSQFSSFLEAQQAGNQHFGTLIDWIENRLGERIRVEDLAEVAGMSTRTFHRKFTAAMQITPARYLEERKMEWAKRLLEAGHSVKAVTGKSGFSSEAAFRAAFTERFGIPPSLHAKLNQYGS